MNVSLLKVLDKIITVSNRLASTVKETARCYDVEGHEHVITFEYRVRVLVDPPMPRLQETGSLLRAVLHRET